MRSATVSNPARSTCNAAVGITGWKYKPNYTRRPYRHERDQGALRLGLRLIKGLGEDAGHAHRSQSALIAIARIWRLRAALSTTELGCLARAGALAAPVRTSLSGALGRRGNSAAGRVVESRRSHTTPIAPTVRLPAPTDGQNLLADYSYLTLTLGPASAAIAARSQRACAVAAAPSSCASYQHGQFIQVAGLVTCRQRPSSASGVVFLTLEDETGNINVLVWTSVLERYRAELLTGSIAADQRNGRARRRSHSRHRRPRDRPHGAARNTGDRRQPRHARSSHATFTNRTRNARSTLQLPWALALRQFVTLRVALWLL